MLRVRYSILGAAFAVIIGARSGAESPAPAASPPSDPPKTLPQDGFFSSLKQAARQGYDREVVRGHFDISSPSTTRRYYCLVDVKTGSREPNGVVGDLLQNRDGTTGIKGSSVSLYSCANAEQQGMLVTSGYVLIGAAAAATPTAQAQKPVQAPSPPAAAPEKAGTLPERIAQPSAPIDIAQLDVGGVKLGMSPDDVRAVLKSKKLLQYTESGETLSYLDPAKGGVQPVPNGRFVSVIAAWTPPAGSGAGDAYAGDGEAYQVMFTPVPGRERAMGIVHSVGYSPANAIREVALENGLIKKYGGFAGVNDLPQSPTWRVQSSGNLQVGDPCNGRAIFGGLGLLNVSSGPRENLALKRTPEDFQLQIEHCGAAILTEDHYTTNGGALREDRLVTRFTVSAYSPAFGLDGARTAAQLIQAAGGTVKKSDAARARDQAVPSL